MPLGWWWNHRITLKSNYMQEALQSISLLPRNFFHLLSLHSPMLLYQLWSTSICVFCKVHTEGLFFRGFSHVFSFFEKKGEVKWLLSFFGTGVCKLHQNLNFVGCHCAPLLLHCMQDYSTVNWLEARSVRTPIILNFLTWQPFMFSFHCYKAYPLNRRV